MPTTPSNSNTHAPSTCASTGYGTESIRINLSSTEPWGPRISLIISPSTTQPCTTNACVLCTFMNQLPEQPILAILMHTVRVCLSLWHPPEVATIPLHPAHKDLPVGQSPTAVASHDCLVDTYLSMQGDHASMFLPIVESFIMNANA